MGSSNETAITTDTCLFFVDDSNVWIEAQKFAASGNSHMPKLINRKSDPRLRIDIGKLSDTLCKGRRRGLSNLYGSRPPPNRAVWEQFENYQFRANIFDRSNGKEKEVDNSMASDMAGKATELVIRAEYSHEAKLRKARTVFIAISGDRDMIPPVKKVLENGIRVELWAWDAGISKDFFKLQSLYPGLLSVCLLNWIFSDIIFTNCRSTRKDGRIIPSQSIVFSATEPDEGDLEKYICNQLLQWGRLFFTTLTKTKTTIYVEFPDVQNLDAVLSKAIQLFPDLEVLSWPEYAGRFQTRPSITYEISNVYEPVMEQDEKMPPKDATPKKDQETSIPIANPWSRGIVEPSARTEGHHEMRSRQDIDDADADADADADNSGGWTPVQRSNPTKNHHRFRNKAQLCPAGIRCEKRGDCSYHHTDEERSLFQERPYGNFRLWKTAKCTKSNPHPSKRCSFAHSQEEAWCRRCGVEGHYFHDCIYRAQKGEQLPQLLDVSQSSVHGGTF